MRPAWNPLDAARNLFPRLYPRMIEIIQQIGASGLVAMPTEQDLKGPLADDIRRYYQAARADAFDRVPLFRLAWDTAVSAFAGSLPSPDKDRATASCMRLAAKMQADASMDNWRNRMKVWPCLKEAGGSAHLAAVTGGQRP